ncbi:MAG: hypothetical protein AAFQ83_09140 [Bacteroidota bacterium]
MKNLTSKFQVLTEQKLRVIRGGTNDSGSHTSSGGSSPLVAVKIGDVNGSATSDS